MGYFKNVKPRKDFSPWAIHHFYSGGVITLFGFILMFQEIVQSWLYLFVMAIGLWVLIDDIVQHHIQKQEVKLYGYYVTVSFWHWFPYKLIGKSCK